ncbi:hypothetical protein A3711_06780 [Erythrobacter sp. HI00D59]|nr:hypothetical protein A3711_06780 [Erythrobacter sp. HI00D59]
MLVQGDLVLTDSSVICAWLDEQYADRHPLQPVIPAGRRVALEEAGAPLSETSYALKEPRQGVMTL